MSSPPSVLIAYVPAPHAGYLKLFRAHAEKFFYVLGDEFIQEFPALVRHLPGVTPEESQAMIRALDIFEEVSILTLENIDSVLPWPITMPDEDVAHALAKKYFARAQVSYDGSWRLRWDWDATQKNLHPEGERIISVEELDRDFMRSALRESSRSPDWWRQVGALLVKEGKVLIVAFNRHVPHDQSAYLSGDPRSNFESGQSVEISGALHAETGLIAEAARRGISMQNCDLYVTTFPCPACAFSCAFTGIRRLFYADGYHRVAGAEALEAKGVEIIRVEM